MRRASILLLVAATTSCMFGMTDEKFIPAHKPHGIETVITMGSITLGGELIELQDSGMVILSSWMKSVLHGQRIEKQEHVLRLVSYASITHAAFRQLDSSYAVSNGQPPTGKVRERLRLVSRFPYGMSTEVLAGLLRACGQTALAGVEP